jgi:hypothetical protein
LYASCLRARPDSASPYRAVTTHVRINSPKTSLWFSSRSELLPGSRHFHFTYTFFLSIRTTLARYRHLYYPTYFALRTATGNPNFPAFKTRRSLRRRPGHFRGCDEFTVERKAVLRRLEHLAATLALVRQATEQINHRANLDAHAPSTIECGCCFAEYEVEDTVRCQKGHRFCKECVKSQAETILGQRKCSITCMDITGPSLIVLSLASCS